MVTLDNWRSRMSEDMRLRDYRPTTQEAYLLADELTRKTLPRKFAGAGPSAIGLFVARLGDPEQSVRRVAYSLLRLLLDKPLLFDPNAPDHDRRIMLKPIRDWFEREGKNLAWDEQTGRFQS